MNRPYYYIIVALISLLFVACSETDQDTKTGKEDTVKVTFELSAKAVDGKPKDPISNNELINNYHIVFVNNSGTVVETLTKTCAPTELDEFSLAMAPGSYYVYAFANIPESYIATLGLNKGTTISNFPNALNNTYYPIPEVFNTEVLVPVDTYTGNIPMTGKEAQQITVSERATQSFGIEVRRLFAKIQFDYTNNTENDLKIRAQSISNLTLNQSTTIGSVKLMNYNDNNVQLSPTARIATLKHDYASTPISVTKNGGTGTKSFYVLESVADAITKSFLLDFDVVKSGEDPENEEDYMRYALTDPQTLTSIHRNDWIRIPITFGDWQMRLKAHTYPPIGGYPEADVKENESNEFTVTFQGGGKFSIRPFIRKYYDGSDWFGIDNTKKVVGTPDIKISDPQLLFNSGPELTESGEIIGTMRIFSGLTASITISIDVVESESPLITKKLTRKIFVNQK